MFRQPITLTNLTFTLNHKTCFEGFNQQIHYGDRIALIGNNGSGKSTLLKMLMGSVEPSHGSIKVPDDIVFGYVPQIIEAFNTASGGQRFNKTLTQALALDPNVLILDEPTNHLDEHNRTALMRMLRSYKGTLIIASHDVELLRTCVDTLWHIDNGKVHVFSGSYDEYMRTIRQKRTGIEQELTHLNRQKNDTHQMLMQEQKRTKSSKSYGEKMKQQGRWTPLTAGGKKRQAEITSGKNKHAITIKKQALVEQLAELRLPEIIKPKFSLTAADIGTKTLVSISQGAVGYEAPILNNINLSIASTNRIAIKGDNGSGKSTLIKAMLRDANVTTSGDWQLPKQTDIGYLDQHYSTLAPEKSVLELVQDYNPDMTHAEARKHLNDFLFRKNEEVTALVKTLSGGEKARASLALIAAKTPRLLILDEITNNLDLETREHVIQVLKEYPGALIVISHDLDFLERIEIDITYVIKEGKLVNT